MPRSDIVLMEGDVLVLLGTQEDITAAEMYLTSGKAR
jgi:K+/H+ antiporter YhaU regulatory subunit KhtT